MRGLIVSAILLAMTAGSAAAQGIDCGKARTGSEKAICGSPGLMALDRQIAAEYAAGVALHPDQAAAMKTATVAWLRQRDAACHLPSSQMGQCLAKQMTARLAALAPTQALVPTQAVANTAPPPPRVLAPPVIVPQPVPAVPSADDPVPPAASLAPTSFPAAPEVDADLRVTSPGRFTLAASSKAGTALQLVDMLTGPSDLVGEAGARDGRMDVLLDVGTYRVRAFSAPGADGPVRITVTPFQDAAPSRALPAPGETWSATLRDQQQRSFWLLVPPSGQVDIEVAGRALADLRLWRAGRSLEALAPASRMIEPAPGHAMLDLRLSGKIVPGVYRVVAYGGPAAPWADGSDEMPIHVRAGVSPALDEGWVGGAVGPLGTERYAAPAFAGLFRLDLPAAAAARLSVGDQAGSLDRLSRTPGLSLQVVPGRAQSVEVSGQAGQPFTLRAIVPPGPTTFSRPGIWWVSAVAAGAGGDGVPPTVLLERSEAVGPDRILGGNLPPLPWSGHFNLLGPTTMLFGNPAGGPVAVRSVGMALGDDSAIARQYDVPAGTYVLSLRPAPGAVGAVDVTLGPPGAAPQPTPPLPADPMIPLGVQTVAPGQTLWLLSQTAPSSRTGLSLRPVPVALAEGPLTVTQAAGGPAVTVPVAIAPGGILIASEIGGGPVPVQLAPAEGDAQQVTIPSATQARSVVLAWRRPAAPMPDIPPPPPRAAETVLQPGQPVGFDLARDDTRVFALDVPEGGLFRVETTGLLRTAGQLSTDFIPALDQDEASGSGQNMLLQDVLRAGRYQVAISAKASAGHLAVVASPATLLAGAALIPGGAVRASLPAGTGIGFPVSVPAAGDYLLEVLGLARPFTAWLDDAQGWPLTQRGDLSALPITLPAGTSRLLVAPDPVGRTLIARLTVMVTPMPVTGHGPTALAFGTPRTATWREPVAAGQPRDPDLWRFALAGPADVRLAIGEGMEARILDEAGQIKARLTGRWAGRLAPGQYRVEAESVGRNDRLDYTIALTASQLQPDEVRRVTLPASVPFSLGEARVASLSSWGAIPVRAVLRRRDGGVVTRVGARADDWNIAVSRLLPAGDYVLDVRQAAPPSGAVTTDRDPGLVPPADPDATSSDDSDSDTTPAMSTSADSDGDAPQPATSGQVAQTVPAAPATDDDTDTAAPADATPAKIDLRLALPPALPPQTPTDQPLPGVGLHVVDVPQPAADGLVIVQAEAADPTVLALERQDATGWQTVALDTGRRPMVAAMGDSDRRPWRVQAWAVDGGDAPITVRVRNLIPTEPASAGTLLAIPGLDLGAASFRLPGPGMLDVSGATQLAGWPGHGSQPVEDGHVVTQSGTVWLIGAPGPASATPTRFPADREIVMTIPASGEASLPPMPSPPGRLLLWRAAAGLGQPSFSGPGGLGPGTALAPADAPTILRDGEGDAAMRARVTLQSVTLMQMALPGAVLVPAHAAVPIDISAGEATITLPAGMSAFTDTAVAWAAAAPLTRSLAVDAKLILVNPGDAAAPVDVAWQAGPIPAMRPGVVFRRFFGAAGSFDTAVEGEGRVSVAGNATLLWQGADGTVRRGRSLSVRAGRLVVTHAPGAVVLSMNAPGISPWPVVAPVPVTLPASIVLDGPAMAVSVAPGAPMLLRATTTAPVLLGLGDRAPALFGQGAVWSRVVAGDATILRLYAPQDGALSGTLTLQGAPIHPITEGVGQAVAVPPGGSAAFGFTLARSGLVGLGVRAAPDRVRTQLLDAAGRVLGEGVAQLRRLEAGSYVIMATVPADGEPASVRPALVGVTPRGNGPPPDVAARYLELAGIKPVAEPVK